MVLRQNGYPDAFIRSSAQPQPTQDLDDQEMERRDDGVQRPPLVMLPYVAGISEDVRRVCRRFGLKVIFKSGRSLRSVLTKVKDTLPAEKQSKVVYQIPCSCGRAYIGETTRRLETRMKEHQDACCRGMVEKSAVAEHAWEHHHPIEWEGTRVIDRAGRSKEFQLTEALHIQTATGELLNRDIGLEVPGCWLATQKRRQGVVDRGQSRARNS